MRLVRCFAQAARQSIFVRWCRLVRGDGISATRGFAGGFFFEETAAHQIIPFSAVGSRLFVNLSVGFALRNVDGTVGAHEGLVVTTARTGGGQYLVKCAHITLWGIIVEDAHDIVEMLTIFEVAATSGCH